MWLPDIRGNPVGALSERPLDPVGGALGERPYENDLTGRPNPEIGSDEAFDTAPFRKADGL